MKRNILFVDDDKKILNGLKRMLHDQRDDWRMDFVSSVDEALKAIEGNDFGKYDVIVSDVKMPVKTGLDLLSELKNNGTTNNLLVIILTGLNEHDLKRKALELGAIDLLNKPVQHEDLLARINSVLKLKDYQDELIQKNVMLEEQLMQKQKMEVIGNLASGAFHDMNNILAIIGGYSQLVKINPKLIEKSMTQINESCKLASKLIRQVLEFAKSKKETKELLDLGKIVEDAVELLRHCIPKRVEISVNKPDELPTTMLNQPQIFQLLMNLCVNAGRAITEKGEIIINISQITYDGDVDDPSEEEKIPSGHYLVLAVSDSGFGMGDRTLNGILKPFFSKNQEDGGTGLGMAVVQRIIANHNGKIRIASTAGEGTKVSIYIPTGLGKCN